MAKYLNKLTSGRKGRFLRTERPALLLGKAWWRKVGWLAHGLQSESRGDVLALSSFLSCLGSAFPPQTKKHVFCALFEIGPHCVFLDGLKLTLHQVGLEFTEVACFFLLSVLGDLNYSQVDKNMHPHCPDDLKR